MLLPLTPLPPAPVMAACSAACCTAAILGLTIFLEIPFISFLLGISFLLPESHAFLFLAYVLILVSHSLQ